MNSGERLSPRAERTAALVSESGRRRVAPAELWAILDKADPALGTDARRRAILAEVVSELAAAGLVVLPSQRSYDRTERPPLPQFVSLPALPPSSSARRPVVWHPELAWVPDARLTHVQHDHMEAVCRWLHATRAPTPVPLRERSLVIFGDEKLLERLLPTSLFASGRLTLSLLATYRAVVPFTSEPAGTGDLMLVAENSDTYDSLVRTLRERADHRVGLVAWGAGAAFEASVLSVSRLTAPVTDIAYFGDLDEPGLRIPANAAALAAREGLPLIRPATGLYTALLARARTGPAQRSLAAADAADLAAWLNPVHRGAVTRFLMDGVRAAQEAVGRDYLTTHDEWLTDLR